jgi:hypothetical protein
MAARRFLLAAALRAAYFGACALVWVTAKPWLDEGEPGTLFLLLMNVITFPAGLLAAPVLAAADWLLDRTPMLSEMPTWFVHFAGYVIAGYAQWFWWAPSAMRRRNPIRES